MRLLPGYAYKRCNCCRRFRAEAACTYSLARCPILYSRERAALDWCEALTLLPQSAAPDNVYEKLESVFSPEEIVELTFVIIAINSWNILGVGFRTDVGNCSSDSLRKSHS